MNLPENGLPFGITDPNISGLYDKLPEHCKSCSVVLEILGGVAVTIKRYEVGLDSNTHFGFVLADSGVDLEMLMVFSEENECKGPSRGDEESHRPVCPTQWLIGNSTNRANYGISDPARLLENHIEYGKRPPGYRNQ